MYLKDTADATPALNDKSASLDKFVLHQHYLNPYEQRIKETSQIAPEDCNRLCFNKVRQVRIHNMQ